MFTIALLPYFEKTFNILTVFRLIELGDLSHPLLRKLSLEAPNFSTFDDGGCFI